MKKFLALLVAAMLCLSVSFAMAEAVVVENCDNGAWVPFEDYGFQICLPADWNMLELTEEQANSGVFFSCANPEGTRTFTVAYNDLGAVTTIEDVSAQLAAAYTDVKALTINDMDFVTYTVAESDVAGICTLGGEGTGLYQFVFYPASDTDYGTLAMQIAASIHAIEE